MKPMIKTVGYALLFSGLSVFAVISAVLWLISDYNGTGPEPLALAGISTAFGLFFLAGKTVNTPTKSQRSNLPWVGILFVTASLAFVAISILLPPFKVTEPASWIYQPLRYLNAFFVLIAFLMFCWGSALLLWTMPFAYLPQTRRRRANKPQPPTFPPY